MDKIYKKICAQCGKEFETTHSRYITCSYECGLERRREQDRVNKARHKEKYKEAQREYAKMRHGNGKIVPPKQKKWIQLYNKGDHLTKLAMVARANGMSYGMLQTMPKSELDKLCFDTIVRMNDVIC